MPKTKKSLSKSLKEKLPEHAQSIYVKAFNSAWDEYRQKESRRGKISRDAAANKVAWAAVKKKYRKGRDDKWHKKGR